MMTLPVKSRGSCGCGASVASSDSPAPRRQSNAPFVRRAVELAGWIVPGTLLAFFPKCPLCVAGYVALATGLGISLAAATYLRWTLLALCVGSLALMAARRMTKARSKLAPGFSVDRNR